MREKLLERLVAIRKRAGLSARELSLKINRSEGYISRLEAGNHFPPIEDIEVMLKICNSNFRELFCEEFDTYQLDQEVFEIVSKASSKEKEVVLTILAMMFHQRQESEKKTS